MKRRKLTKIERWEIYDKCHGYCAYCGSPLEYKDMQVDHVIPLYNGGKDELDNMLPACRSCNHYKSTLSLDGFRRMIDRIPNTLYRDSANLKYIIKDEEFIVAYDDGEMHHDLKDIPTEAYDYIPEVRAEILAIYEDVKDLKRMGIAI